MAGVAAAAAVVRLKPLSLPFPSSSSSFPFFFFSSSSYSNKLLLPLRSSIPSAAKTMSSSDTATTKTKTIDSHLHVWATPQQVQETLIQTISSTETEALIRSSFSGCSWVPLLSRPGAHVARRRRFLAQGMWVISIRAPVCFHGIELIGIHGRLGSKVVPPTSLFCAYFPPFLGCVVFALCLLVFPWKCNCR